MKAVWCFSGVAIVESGRIWKAQTALQHKGYLVIVENWQPLFAELIIRWCRVRLSGGPPEFPSKIMQLKPPCRAAFLRLGPAVTKT